MRSAGPRWATSTARPKRATPFQVDEQVKALPLIGDIASKDDDVKLHAHVVVGQYDGSTLGPLLNATLRPALEVLLVDSPSN